MKLCPRSGGGVEEGTLRSPRVWIVLLQQGAGRGEMTGAGGLPLPWSRNWQEADSAIMAGQAERIFCVTELGQSRQWSELQCHKLFFFFLDFLMWTILKIKSLLKSVTILLLFYVSIF